MATPQLNLAASLEVLHALQTQKVTAIRSSQISRIHRERLQKNGYLQEVMKGWYIATSPQDQPGDTTAWYVAYWDFLAAYLTHRFGDQWCLSPEASLQLHAGNRSIGKQTVIHAPHASNNVILLPYDTSVLEVRTELPPEQTVVDGAGLRLRTVASALIGVSPTFFTHHEVDARVALATYQDASPLVALLLDGGNSVIAGRLVGAFRAVGNSRAAQEIAAGMQAAGYTLRVTNPFHRAPSVGELNRQACSPHAQRLTVMWHRMREEVIKRFPPPPAGSLPEADSYLRQMDDAYAADAYHSLSIEGYQVSPDLIERVRTNGWNPEGNARDSQDRDAFAARGYFLAHSRVKQSVTQVLAGANPGQVAEEDHASWYQQLFAPSVSAGLLKASDLAGYRTGTVFIRNSAHAPMAPEAVREALPAFFDLLRHEADPGVRVVLGHFLFVYIHPYLDGNGRMGRFLMNLMLAAGGYRWTVIPVTRRADYMNALEQASTSNDIAPFTDFLAEMVGAG